ncbi:putative bifunctional diguanylate cyclase/phosphodiesterase [Sphingomonas sp. R86520]|uniref:putative bifunctional diguanylate cyclase/phosphodiesterase n=1 Tax=Sphingomonas sp. R86520 TaxID=3093859 RepID=UPI0036D23982
MLRNLRHLTRSDDPLPTTKAARSIRLVDAFEAEGSGWFWETDPDGTITYISDHIRQNLCSDALDAGTATLPQILEIDPEGISSRTLHFQLSTRAGFHNVAVRAIEQSIPVFWAISGQPRFDSEGVFQGYVGSGSDLAERRRSQADITRLAYTDALTGLANRERMRNALERLLLARQSGFHPTALLLLDLDRFKAVNDTLGHQTGDELLRRVAQRIQRVVGTDGAVGRLGGDEFKVILASDTARRDAEAIATDIIHSVSQPYLIESAPITIGCSIGIAIAPEHGQTVDHLVRNADLALYAAKDGGRGLHRVYTDDMLVEATHRKHLEDDLRQALAQNELYVVYQPVVSMVTTLIVGYEALVRWEHPVRGAVSPAEFIPIAEEIGLIDGIGEWVLRTAVADCAKWPAGIRVAVNVSPIQFANPKLPSVVANALISATLAADRLELEITENVFLNEGSCTDQMFKALKSLGVRLALDDFGTGYSSLGYLKNAPFDKIKIDQSFIRGAIVAGNRNAAIIRAIVTLADTLGMETTAEGVEQQDEIAFIRELGCSHIQGYVYGRPARIEHVLACLSDYGAPAEAVGHKVSRAPREKVLRKAQLLQGSNRTQIIVRNFSANGAMIEGCNFNNTDVGASVLIELVDGHILSGSVRWVNTGRVGIEFSKSVDQKIII